MRAAIYARQSRGKAKSIEDQVTEARQDAGEQGYDVVSEYRDGKSASRYARSRRREWPQVLEALERREFDVIVLWEASRGDRTLTSWSAFLDVCRDKRILIRVVNDERTYDVSRSTDWDTLARAGVDSATESAKLSKRIARGVASAAASGRPPAGPCPYGYRRVYDSATGELVGQEEDPETAPIVREIVTRVGNGDPVSRITRELNERGVTPPGGGREWYRQRVTNLAGSPVYVGRRVHRPGRGSGHEGPRAVHEASWPALVTEAEHYAALRILTAPERSRHIRPGAQRHLLTHLAVCDRCGTPLVARKGDLICETPGEGGHVSIRMRLADTRVTELVIAYLTRADVHETLRAQGDHEDEAVLRARDEVARLRTRLDEWRASAARGETSPASLAAIEGPLVQQIEDADRIAYQAGIPRALRQILSPGEDVRARWDAAPLPAKRDIIRCLVNVRIASAGPTRHAPVEERVKVTPVSSNRSHETN